MDICIDFDGTCVTHEFPKVGRDIGAAPVLKRLVEAGHNLILFTMRSNCLGNTVGPVCVPEVHNGNFLDDAVNWFKENNIPLYGIQSNPTQKEWTNSPKAYGQLYIDDAALGTPLLQDFTKEGTGDYVNSCSPEHLDIFKVKLNLIGRPYVDWRLVEGYLMRKGLIPIREQEDVTF